MFNNVQLFLVFQEIILHFHNPVIKLFVFINLNISYKYETNMKVADIVNRIILESEHFAKLKLGSIAYISQM